MHDLKNKVRQPLFSNEGCKEDREVVWDLPAKLDNYKDEQEEHQQEIEVKADEREMYQEKIKAESGLQGDEDTPRKDIFYSKCTV